MRADPLPDEPGVQHVTLDFVAIEGEEYEVEIRPHPGERVVKLMTQSRAELRDWVGITADVFRVMEMCRAYREAIKDNALQAVQDALWMTAIVLYSRCFNEGVRLRLDKSILSSLPGDALAAHEHFRDLRDKFVTHSVNAFEQSESYAVLRTEPGKRELLNTGTAHSWANPLNLEGAATLHRLASFSYSYALARRNELSLAADNEARALGLDGLYAMPDLTFDPPNVQKAKRRRR